MNIAYNLNLGRALTKRSAGVTLIELLVVMAIIVILMSLLFPIIASVRRKGKIRATEMLISSVDAALKQYHSEFDAFPIGSNAMDLYNSQDKGALYTSLCGVNNGGVDDPLTKKHFAAFTEFQAENLKKDSGNLVVVDHWGQPLFYLNSEDLIRNNGDSTRVHNPNGVDIFSTGPDKIIDPGNNLTDDNGNKLVDEPAELVDDITNFAGRVGN